MAKIVEFVMNDPLQKCADYKPDLIMGLVAKARHPRLAMFGA